SRSFSSNAGAGLPSFALARASLFSSDFFSGGSALTAAGLVPSSPSSAFAACFASPTFDGSAVVFDDCSLEHESPAIANDAVSAHTNVFSLMKCCLGFARKLGKGESTRSGSRLAHSEDTARRTPSTAAGAVVTILCTVDDAVTAELTQLAAFSALAVTAVVDTVVTLFAETEHTVATHRSAIARRGFEAR